MLINHLKSGYRNLTRSSTFALVNIVGMTIAIATCLLLFMYVQREYSFDRHFGDSHKTYRIISRVADGVFYTQTFACYADALLNVPEVESVTSFLTIPNGVIDFEGEIAMTENIAVVDSNFIEFFSLPMVAGNIDDITRPNVIFLTPKMVATLFGDKDPIGQSVYFRAYGDSIGHYTIRGIISTPPNESHLTFDMIVSQQGDMLERYNRHKSMKVFANRVYVKLHNNANKLQLEESLHSLAEPYIGTSQGPPLDAFETKLQPIQDIHFTPGLNLEQKEGTPKYAVTILLSIGVIILLVAIINFINLYIANAQTRLKRAGIIKIHGANLGGMILAVLPEILLMMLISLTLATAILVVISLYFSTLFKDWAFTPWSIEYLFWAISLILVIVITSTIVSSYYYSRKSALQLLSSGNNRNSGSISKSAGLIVGQFVVVIILIGATILINKQLKFMNSRNLGYRIENVIVASFPSHRMDVNVICNELQRIPGVISASTALHHPTHPFQSYNFLSANSIDIPFSSRWIDKETLETLDINIIHRFTNIENGWVINKTFYNNLLLHFSEDDIASSNFSTLQSEQDNSRQPFIVAAVVDDFHYASLHSPIENFAFNIISPVGRFLMISYHPSQRQNVISEVNATMKKLFPNLPFDYFFLDESVNSAYHSEKQLGVLIRLFSIIGIAIATMGLFGLSLMMSQRRIKEIGIRKVNGAKIWEVMLMLNKDFVKWVVIAFVIATPIAYYAMNRWLQNFAYKTEISWWIFALAGLLALGIALLTVSWQSWRAARRNPVEALRYE
jgi:putative ABC transport system permease protein